MTTPQLWHCLRYTDADRAIDFLTAMGFTADLVVRDEHNPTVVAHAQLRWRETGGVMLGSKREDAKNPYLNQPGGACSLSVASDDEVDATLARAVEAGGRLVDPATDQPYGGRSGGVLDHEDHYWNVDSYVG